ncbi:MAG: AraC family transcriptional regulator [Phycisphaeraceae bacterium]
MKKSPAKLATLQNLHDQLRIRVLACDYLQIDRTWNVRDVRSPFWRLYVSGRDGAGVELPGGLYRLTRDRIHLIPAWVSFSCRCDRPVQHLYIHFELPGLPGAMSREMFDRPVTLRADALAEGLCARLAASVAGGEQTRIVALAKAAVYLSLGMLLEQLQVRWTKRINHIADQTGPIWPAMQYIESHPGERIDNERLAELCDLSCDHFARRFRQIVGQTPARYLLERRIALAAQELIFTEHRIGYIARQCGFTNRFHFTRVFTSQMGVPPATYRRRTHV